PNLPPVFVLGPRVNNAVLSNGTLFVVVADTQAVFIAAATDPNSDPVSYSWNFGDGDTATGDLVQHTYSACGPFSASAVASDGSLSNTAPLTVSVACQFDTNATTKLQMKVNFAKPDADSVKFQGEVGLDPAFAITGKQVLLSVGDATLAFVLDSQGKGTNPLGKFQIKFNSKTGNWTVKASFSKGTWRTPWATYGLTNTTNAKPGVAVTVPVILVVGSDSFMIDRVLTYTSTKDKSGQAK
ncbi:MAG: PKD domain-containing protein, partial [Verrucomicrobiota bacterium]